jgi:hypothetical protein
VEMTVAITVVRGHLLLASAGSDCSRIYPSASSDSHFGMSVKQDDFDEDLTGLYCPARIGPQVLIFRPVGFLVRMLALIRVIASVRPLSNW